MYKDQYDPKTAQDLFTKKQLIGMQPIGKVRSVMIMASGRSWWEAQYASGKTVAEWDTLQGSVFTPMGNPATSRWEEISKKDLVAIRLLCPNGKAGELRTAGSYCIFQLKSGAISQTAGIGFGKIKATADLHCHYHIIGVIKDNNGNCDCYAWDYSNKHLLKFSDNVLNMRFNNIGALSLGDAVGIK